MNWYEELRDLLCGYFSQALRDEAIAELVGVSTAAPDYHARFLGAMAWGEAASANGDERARDLLGSCDTYAAESLEDARAFFHDLIQSYLAAFDAELAQAP